MNERIQELAEQAGMKECSLGYGMPENVLWGENQIKEFAELIVRECADIATINQHEWHSAGSYVLKHFGFEQ